MTKLSHTARKLDTLFRILYILVTILMVSAVVGISIIAVGFLFDLNPHLIGTGYHSLDIGFIELEVLPQYAPDTSLILLQAAISLVLGFVSALFGRKAIQLILQILQPMMDGIPFNRIVTENLRKLGKLTIVLGIILNVLTIADQAMLVFLLDLPSLLISDTITHVSGNFVLNLDFLVISAVFFLLSYIFQYGEELQQLSDETL